MLQNKLSDLKKDADQLFFYNQGIEINKGELKWTQARFQVGLSKLTSMPVLRPNENV